MSLINALSLARDVALMAALASAGGVSVIAVAGLQVGLGVAASMSLVAFTALAAMCLYSLLAFLGEGVAAAAPWAGAAMALGLLALAPQYFGARGLWVGCLVVIGVGSAALFLWAFGGRLSGWFGAAAPAAAYAAVAVVLASSLAATARSAGVATATAQPRSAQALFSTPPEWFDCAYSQLRDRAEESGFCTSNPPEVAASPPWRKSLPTPRLTDAAPERPLAPNPGEWIAPRRPARPTVSATPEQPAVDTPNFEAIIGQEQEDVAPPQPAALGARRAAEAAAFAATETATDSPDPAAQAPSPSLEPSAISRLSASEEGPKVSPAFGSAPTPGAVSEPMAPEDRDALSAESASILSENERLRTEFICFPIVGVLAEQLCPDRRLSISDVEVAWRSAGGAATGAAKQLDCFVEPDRALALSLIIDMTSALQEPLDRINRDSSNKGDGVYDAMTRLIGSVRASAESGRTSLSLYLSSPSPLRSPWVTQSFGDQRSDRVFDIRSSVQTLSLLRRFKSGLQNLRPGAPQRPLVETLLDALRTRPDVSVNAAQPLLLAFADQRAVADLTKSDIERLREALEDVDAPVFMVELGAIAPSGVMRELVEPTGGAAFGARSGAALGDIIERAVSRARSFCAVGVEAPESFFRDNILQVSLRRRMSDGCELHQIATLDCDRVRMDQRIAPPSGASGE
ncbi:MAG: hypothetical protein KTR21_17870 [Rhodobacteraceae bacterium]|nr:hypothetical protein [Paracoccaceae bacterium]